MKRLEIWASFKDNPQSFIQMCSCKVDEHIVRVEIKLVEFEK